MPVKKQNYFFYLLIKWSLPYTMPLIALIVGVSILLMKEKEYFQKEIKMTRKKAIDTLKNGLWWDRKRLDEAIDIAIAALRPISRERAEWIRGEWIELKPEIGLLECSNCGHKILRAKCSFCPSCDSPMTGEAVEMVMERLEELEK